MSQAGAAIAKGTEALTLFLTGMMLLSELARSEGVFDWLASLAVAAAVDRARDCSTCTLFGGYRCHYFLVERHSRGSVTPAARSKGANESSAYLFICTFHRERGKLCANANTANLVVYGKALPR